MRAYARLKEIEVDGKEYQVEFDGEFVEVTEVIEAPSSFGWTYPYKTKISKLERAKAIWQTGKYFSNSKWWKWEHKQAGNYLAGL